MVLHLLHANKNACDQHQFQYSFQYLDGCERPFITIHLGVYIFAEGFSPPSTSYIINFDIMFGWRQKVLCDHSTCELMLKLMRITSVSEFTASQVYFHPQPGELGPDWCDKIDYFLFTYAMAAKNIGDEFMIFFPEVKHPRIYPVFPQ